MKKLTCLFLILLSPAILFANGVGILDAHNAVYLKLDSSMVTVSVQGQISITTTTQYFTNTHAATVVKYAFPLKEQASATQLRWMTSGDWNVASVSGNSQDTSLPGVGTPAANLTTYLGGTPLYFPIPDTLQNGATLAVELTYVELLPYAFGSVSYTYPSDYRLIDAGAIASQILSFQLSSPRTIDSIWSLNGYPAEIGNDGNNASVDIALYGKSALENYSIQYTLNATQLGLFAYSTWPSPSDTADSLGGFLTFIAEPEPGDATATIAKVFTLIVDCSGSMSGTKITQARNAASYIIQNLNDGDKFNIVKFETNVSSFRPQHVDYTTEARDSALAYIAQFAATGSTNISGAFDAAVPQFTPENTNTANIVIFLTDGQPTVGITNISSLVTHIDSLITATELTINLFSFGIGTDANQQLLTLISSQNNGLAAFLGNDELYSRITAFYNTVRNPVLLNSRISFNPPVVDQVYPDPLPNLYKGQQMIVAGRYQQAGPVEITLSGTAFGQPVNYSYNVNLAAAPVDGNQFLAKVWAKRKIESLLVQYYALTSTSAEAQALKAEIIHLSQAYGVISPFTSFVNNPVGCSNCTEIQAKLPGKTPGSPAFELTSGRLNSLTTIHVRLNIDYSGKLEIRIYDMHGKVVKTLSLVAHGQGDYEVTWNGEGPSGFALPSGTYFCAMDLGNTVRVTRILLSK